MKYLKPFNEARSYVNIEELTDFCETNLAYLLDDNNFTLEVDDPVQVTRKVSKILIRLENDKGFMWNDIKDYFIPFMIRFDKIWGDQIDVDNTKKICIQMGESFFPYTAAWYYVDYNDLMNDKTLLNNRNEDQYSQVWYRIHIEIKDE